jgi:hypothetical protein
VRLAASLLACVCVCALAACGDTLQAQPIPHNVLEALVISPYPVYWLGGSFQGLRVSEATHDVGGAFNVEYGNCVEGGQATCVPPLRIVTSPDNSFLPGGSLAHARVPLRGITALVSRGGRTIELATGPVVVDIYAQNARLALAAARTAVPINRVAAPEAPLPAPLPATPFAATPLPVQIPSTPTPLP